MELKQSFWTKDFILLATSNLLMAISFYFMLPVLPIYLTDKLHATKSEVGAILAFYTIAALIIRLFAGWAIDSYGRSRIYLLAFLLFSAMFVTYPIVSSVFGFLLIRFAHGLTWGTLTTSSSTIAVDLIPVSRRGEGIGVFGLSMTIAMAVGPLIAISITNASNYLQLFLTALSISFAGLLLALTIRIPIVSNTNLERFTIKRLVEPSSIPISVNMLVLMFAYGGVLSFISLYGIEIGIMNSGLFFLILSIGIGFSRIFSGRIFDKSGPKSVTIIGISLLIIGFPLLGLLRNVLGFHLAAGIIGFGFGIIMPTFQAMINNLVPANRRGAANSTFFTAFDMGIGIGMIGTGWLAQQYGFKNTFILFSISCIIALGIFVFYSHRHYTNGIKNR
jgi:MFS family permease